MPQSKAVDAGPAGGCMEGNVVVIAAGAFPGRFVAVASFHGSNLVPDEPGSPHRFVKQIAGYVHVDGGVEDASSRNFGRGGGASSG